MKWPLKVILGHSFCNQSQANKGYHFTPPPTGTPASIRIYRVFSETRVIGLHFCRCVYGLSSFKFVQWAPSFLHRFAFWPFKVVQGHPRSIILVPIESAYTTSYYSRSLYMVLSCTVFEMVTYWLKIAYFYYIFATPLSFGALAPYVPLGISR